MSMMDLKAALAQDIWEGIIKAQKAGKLPGVEVQQAWVTVERPGTQEYGQYASPIALRLAKLAKKKPSEMAEVIAAHMPKREYVGAMHELNGFLNVRINPGWMTARLDNVIREGLCDFSMGNQKRVNLEFLSANPTGPMTLANARGAFYADTLANVLACAGWEVTREYYVNDAGVQVRRLGESVLRRILEAQNIKVDFPEELYQGDYVKELARMLAEEWRENEGREFTEDDLQDAGLIERLSERAAAEMLRGIKKVSGEVLKVDFDVWTSERSLRGSGTVEETLDKLRAAGATYVKDGVEFLKTTTHGDSEDRALIKGNGEYTYLLPDIAYHRDKYERKYDLIFTFVGADHQGHLPRLIAAMKMLGYDTDKLRLVAMQLFRLVRDGQVVKMSKRAGQIVTPADLVNEVGYDAARFGLTAHSPNTAMDFDLDVAKERSEKNPVYYVQYAHVRLQSILRKAKEEGVIAELDVTFDMMSSPSLTHTFELALLHQIYRFPEVVNQVTRTYAVHDLTYYARDLAEAVHAFYKNVRVLQSDERMIQGRLQLVLAARTVLGKVLDLLGISKPEVM